MRPRRGPAQARLRTSPRLTGLTGLARGGFTQSGTVVAGSRGVVEVVELHLVSAPPFGGSPGWGEGESEGEGEGEGAGEGEGEGWG